MDYPGGKNGGGAYQKIICQMPPHQTYIEPFLGSGAVLRNKRPASVNIGIDIDPGVVEAFDYGIPGKQLIVKCCDGISFLKAYQLREQWTRQHLVYCDPPYLISTRRRRSPIYLHEMSEEQHFDLLQTLLDISSWGVNIIISGYSSELYSRALIGWRMYSFQMMTRGGKPATEFLWMNFPEPIELHDYSYLGENRTERQRIKRKSDRWKNKLQAMPTLERQALLAAIQSLQGRSK